MREKVGITDRNKCPAVLGVHSFGSSAHPRKDGRHAFLWGEMERSEDGRGINTFWGGGKVSWAGAYLIVSFSV